MRIENRLSTPPGAYPVVECFHIAGCALAIGMTALVDFRLPGFGLLGQSPAQITRAFRWWTPGGLVISVFSGLLIFSTDPDMYYLNWSFALLCPALRGDNRRPARGHQDCQKFHEIHSFFRR